jgi:hypothetical protein
MRGLLLALVGLLGACQEIYPEVVVVNLTSPEIQVRDPSFSGCRWSAVLAYGEATSVGQCLPGSDRVHFEKQGTGDASTWFPYQTVTAHTVEYGDLRVIELTLEDMEQDFSVPGPYGH